MSLLGKHQGDSQPMLVQVDEIPEVCPRCGSLNLRGHDAVLQGETNIIFCDDCMSMIIVVENYPEEEDPEEIGTGNLFRCPHCETIDEVGSWAGEEWCHSCGLDPNDCDLPSKRIAHLWKEGSQIKGLLQRGRGEARLKLGKFLRSKCGPHCEFQEPCPQSQKLLARCYKEYREGPEHLLDVECSQPKKVRVGFPTKHVAFLACKKNRVLEKRLTHGIRDKEHNTHT